MGMASQVEYEARQCDSDERRVMVVTGASAGVGRATARELARRGAKIGLISRDGEALAATLRDVEELGGSGIVCVADVADAAAVEAAAARVERHLGPIDVWINNAMVTVVSPIKALEPDEVRRVTEVTYLGAVHGTIAALRRMLPRDRGTIVQVGSALAYRAIPLQAPYCGAKFALRGFTDSLRTELLHDKSRVRVTMVHMPALNTPQFDWCRTRMPRRPQPVPPIFEPEVAARAIAWAIDHRRRELRVGAPTWEAVLANKVFPRLLDRYLARTCYASQQTDEPVKSDRQDNLYSPVRGDRGARGSFTSRARDTSVALWADTHRWSLVALATGVLGAVYLGRRARGR
jgi:NAD(P)-dependent dehydrogenase (short-subunit alcohol dehydrogenase family)